MLSPKRVDIPLKPPRFLWLYCLITHAVSFVLMLLLPLSPLIIMFAGVLLLLNLYRLARKGPYDHEGSLVYQNGLWYLIKIEVFQHIEPPQFLVVSPYWLVLSIRRPDEKWPRVVYFSSRCLCEADYRWLCRYHRLSIA